MPYGTLSEGDQAAPPALIVAGPTCSGKSALALDLAETLGGTIVNADSMQVYRELRIVTARPDDADLARAPHALYGVLPAATAGSVAWWRGEALAAMDSTRAAGRVPILCGGTGLYFAALTEGLSDVPPIDAATRAEARARIAADGAPVLHAALASVDPATSARIRPSDAQRVARAWEVWRATGRGLAAWQAARSAPAPWRFAALVIDPPRDTLRDAIARRFASMLAAGALDEVRALLAHDLDPALPAMRAHGVPELAAHLRGALTLTEAVRRAELVTGQYTKRQATWLRHHLLAPSHRTRTIHARYSDFAQFSECDRAAMHQFIRDSG